ncbi:Mu transposase C-terminal domain-containing protein, partial [Planktotalea sp.]
IGYWSDAFASMLGRGQGKVMVKYDPRDLSQIWVIDEDGHVIVARYRDLSHPRISLWESRRARKEWQDKNIGRMTEGSLKLRVDRPDLQGWMSNAMSGNLKIRRSVILRVKCLRLILATLTFQLIR